MGGGGTNANQGVPEPSDRALFEEQFGTVSLPGELPECVPCLVLIQRRNQPASPEKAVTMRQDLESGTTQTLDPAKKDRPEQTAALLVNSGRISSGILARYDSTNISIDN
jgi:hypothetical protein